MDQNSAHVHTDQQKHIAEHLKIQMGLNTIQSYTGACFEKITLKFNMKLFNRKRSESQFSLCRWFYHEVGRKALIGKLQFVLPGNIE